MSEKAVRQTFEALFTLTDLRQIFRDTKPSYQLTDEQKRRIKEIVEDVRENLNTIEGELIK